MAAIDRLIEREQEVIRDVLLTGSPLGALDRLDERHLIEILKQRRYLTFAFTPMCEYFLCSLTDNRALAVVSGILREEFGLSATQAPGDGILDSHRRAFLAELEELDVDPHEALACKPTPTTTRALAQLARYIFVLGQRSELEQLIFLRFSGEVLTGIEFKAFYDGLSRRSLLNQERSKFLFPHVDYDVLALGGGASHAERYLDLIEERLDEKRDWARIDKVLIKATTMRSDFYRQFALQ